MIEQFREWLYPDYPTEARMNTIIGNIYKIIKLGYDAVIESLCKGSEVSSEYWSCRKLICWPKRRTPFLISVYFCQETCLEVLLKYKKGNLYITEKLYHQSALHLAAQRGTLNIVKMILSLDNFSSQEERKLYIEINFRALVLAERNEDRKDIANYIRTILNEISYDTKKKSNFQS